MQILGPAGGSDYKDWIKRLLRKQHKEAQVKKTLKTKDKAYLLCFILSGYWIYT